MISQQTQKPDTFLRKLAKKIGSLKYSIYRITKISRGYETEKLLKAEVEDLNVILIGKPDAYRINHDHIILEEFKNKRKPYKRELPWMEDYVQALAYAYILRQNYGKEVKIIVRYKDGVMEAPYDQDLLFFYIMQYVYIVNGTATPEAAKNNRCRICQYKDRC